LLYHRNRDCDGSDKLKDDTCASVEKLVEVVKIVEDDVYRLIKGMIIVKNEYYDMKGKLILNPPGMRKNL